MQLPQQFRALLGHTRTYRARRTPRSMALYFIACALAMALLAMSEDNE